MELSYLQKHQSRLTHISEGENALSRKVNLTVPLPELVWSSGSAKQNQDLLLYSCHLELNLVSA